MTICSKCKKIAVSYAPVYKASRGFVDSDGQFFEDESVIIHQECYYDYTYEPFVALENIIKNN